MVRMLFCNIHLIAGGAWSWREKQRNLSPEVQNFIWLLDQERKLWLSRTSTADFVPSLLPLSPSHSSETWLWDAKNPSKAQLQLQLQKKHSSKPRWEEPSPSWAWAQASRAISRSGAVQCGWPSSQGLCPLLFFIVWSLGMGKAGHRSTCNLVFASAAIQN